MTLICIQCSMKAMLEDKPEPTFEETNAQHMLRCHRDPIATQRERHELERLLTAKLKKEGKLK